MKIYEEEYYRSKPLVNMSDDMVRIKINLTRMEYRRIKSDLLKLIHSVRINPKLEQFDD